MPARPHLARRVVASFFAACVALAGVAAVHAAPQLPDFVYQGRLTQSGAPANGNFDLTFTLYDAATGGLQVGSTINEPNFPVADGLFSVSLAFPGAFTGTQLYLQVTVEGVPLTPRQPVATSPVAQFALSGGTGTGAAGGDLTGTYPNPSIAFGAVTNSKIAAGSVTNSKLADSSVSSVKIATGAVGTSEIANGAVDTAQIATDSVTRGKIAGGYSNGAIAVNVGANDCNDYNVSVPGAEPNDMVFFNLQGDATLPSQMLIQVLKVPSAGIVTLRACNVGSTSASTGDMAIYILTLR